LLTVSNETAGAVSLDKKCADSSPPITAPNKNNRFHRCDFQSKRKNSQDLPAPKAAHIVRKLEENPKLLPSQISESIMAATSAPPMYQGQGFNNHSIIVIFYKHTINYKCRLLNIDIML